MFTFTFMIVAFVIGYIVIALEHPLKINKTATALLLGVLLWVCAIIGGDGMLVNTSGLRDYMLNNPGASYTDWLVHSELLHALGEIAEILFFLMGAMTIVELIDTQGGFKVIADKVSGIKERKLLWIVGILTFFMSAVLDNMTTSIVMVALLRKLVRKQEDRWFFAGMVIIAANSGGAWSPIGDVTTIMLWIAGKVSALNIIEMTIFSSLVSLLIPLVLFTFMLKGDIETPSDDEHEVNFDAAFETKPWQRTLFLVLGVTLLLCVPVFKTLTHLPPYVGMMGALGIMWITSEILHRHDHEEEKSRYSVLSVISRIDLPSILFFLGILLAVNALKTVGQLELLSQNLDKIPMAEPGKYYVINIIIGLLSSIVDNVPLVAGAMGMYNFPQDHYFWEFLAYCAGTGGSILIIGSAAGVAVMGMEKIDFIWYVKRISWVALIGYFAGAGVFIGEKTIRNHFADKEETAVSVPMTQEGIADYLINTTFVVEESDSAANATEYTKFNFVKYTENDVDMLGMSTVDHVTNLAKDTTISFSTANFIMPSQVKMLEVQDTVAAVEFAQQTMLVTKSGVVIIPTGNSYLELKRVNK